MIRINFNVSDDLLKDIDEYANLNGISRTAAISVLCRTSLDQHKMLKLMPLMLNLNEQLDKSKTVVDNLE